MNYTIQLTDNDMRILSAALGALPYIQVAPTIARIQSQVSEQERAARQPEAPTAVDA